MAEFSSTWVLSVVSTVTKEITIFKWANALEPSKTWRFR
jgi:hypothetical protein